MSQDAIIYTITDEAPFCATSALLPIIRAFAAAADVPVETMDISLAGRLISQFPECLTEAQQQPDDLARLGKIVLQPTANIIKLPNISASVPQIKAAIAELQQQGYALPDYPQHPKTEQDKLVRAKYDRVKGSAVNPVLRQGNSDRRASAAVKKYAQAHPHSMGAWAADSKTAVAHMQDNDFYASETAITLNESQAGAAKIVFADAAGSTQVMVQDLPFTSGDIIDAASLSIAALKACVTQAMQQAQQQGILLSLHLKATMMKVSDPIIFGHVVETYFADIFEKYAAQLDALQVQVNNGWGDVLSKIKTLPQAEQQAIAQDIATCMQQAPELAMVDSDQGITNLHVPSDVIVDASMAAMVRAGGKMWGKDGALHDTLAIIPDRCYARMYQTVLDFCREHGAFDPATMGSVANVGLMAQKAEEYGSHDKTFTAPAAGTFQVVSAAGDILLTQQVAAGDIFRCCVTKDIAIRDWVRLAVERATLSQQPLLFWLDQARAHDAEMIKKLEVYLLQQKTDGLQIQTLAPAAAMQFTLEQVKQGKDVIAATGNVLRDYLTDLFPILELGTSAKMLSIVPLLEGGGLFETGAGGSAPKHVQQFQQQRHLRWDSLGEYMALAESLTHYAKTHSASAAKVLAECLEHATARWLQDNRAPGRKLGSLSNNASHVYLAWYWAQALAEQQQDLGLQAHFSPIAEQLTEQLDTILQQLAQTQGQAVDMGGYYHPDAAKVTAAACCSKVFNQIITQ